MVHIDSTSTHTLILPVSTSTHTLILPVWLLEGGETRTAAAASNAVEPESTCVVSAVRAASTMTVAADVAAASRAAGFLAAEAFLGLGRADP
jgi:hypothetical protein